MIIEPHTFKNCSSLEIIDFTCFNEVVHFGFLPDDNISDKLKVIINDKKYDEWVIKNPLIYKYLTVESQIISDKLKAFDNYNILLACYHIQITINYVNNISIKKFLINVCSTLKNKYNINNKEYQNFVELQKQKEKLKNE